MNNEPVAWMYERPNGSAKLVYVREPCDNTVVKEIPLYTHPHSAESVKVKEQDESFDRTASHMAGEYVSYKDLTDEEIMELSYLTSDNDPIVFARAILRKAQEK